MPLDKSQTKAAFSRNVSELMHANHPQKQALAIAYRIQRGKAEGGEVADPWAQGVRAAETGAIAPLPLHDPTASTMAAMGNAGDTVRNLASAPSVGALKGKAAEYGMWLAARKGLLGRAAMVAADPLAWGATAASAPIWASTELNKGEKPFYNEKTKEPLHMADGGTPFFARQGARTLAHSGMIHSTVPGRTDRIGMGVKRNSYVIPADVVSSVGQGNSMAGANAFNHMFKSGPYGASLPSGGGIAKPIRQKFAEGGEVDKPVDIVAAGGEFVVPPEHVERIGGGDMDRGHEILDRMVHHIRKKTIKTLRKLPAPKKS